MIQLQDTASAANASRSAACMQVSIHRTNVHSWDSNAECTLPAHHGSVYNMQREIYCCLVSDEAQHTILSMGTIIAVTLVMPLVVTTQCGGLGRCTFFSMSQHERVVLEAVEG